MWGQVVVAVILIAIVALCIRSIVKDHKNGVSFQCGHSCSTCGAGPGSPCPHEAQFKEQYEEQMLEMEKKALEKLNQKPQQP